MSRFICETNQSGEIQISRDGELLYRGSGSPKDPLLAEQVNIWLAYVSGERTLDSEEETGRVFIPFVGGDGLKEYLSTTPVEVTTLYTTRGAPRLVASVPIELAERLSGLKVKRRNDFPVSIW